MPWSTRFEFCVEIPVKALVCALKDAEALWQESEKLTGVKFDL